LDSVVLDRAAVGVRLRRPGVSLAPRRRGA
jgi:hypothetical protein